MLFHPPKNPVELKIRHLNDAQKQRREDLMEATQGKAALKQFKKVMAKKAKQALKAKTKNKKKHTDNKAQVFVLDFDGDIKATAVKHLREEISTLISTANKGDEVIVRLESGGGLVHGYGLAAAQLVRLKDAGLKLTVCVDKVAASGGYMMACVADKIVAAPFAILGSIGVVAQIPNIHRLLERNTIDVELHTAGKYKRTLTMLGENTEEGREKFKQDLEDTHDLFKRFVSQNRPILDIEAIATGETWYGSEAIENKLADVMMTSDTYLEQYYHDFDVLQVAFREPKALTERLGLGVLSAIEHKATGWLSKVLHHRGY